jgi:hypothetical protein
MADKKEFYVHMTTIIRAGVIHPLVRTNRNGTATEPQWNPVASLYKQPEKFKRNPRNLSKDL